MSAGDHQFLRDVDSDALYALLTERLAIYHDRGAADESNQTIVCPANMCQSFEDHGAENVATSYDERERTYHFEHDRGESVLVAGRSG